MTRIEEIILEFSTSKPVKRDKFLSSLSNSDLDLCLEFFKTGWHINWYITFESEFKKRKIKKRKNNINKII